MNIDDIARTAHNVNKAYCESIGDMSQKPWEESEGWQKDSAIKGVKFIIANPGASPSASHDSWLEEKKRDGWKYGPVKDPTKKEHPCFVEYDKLPVEQKSKDYIFGAIVRSLIPHIGEESVDTTKVLARTEPVKDNRSFEDKIRDNTTYIADGRRIVDLGAVAKS